MAKATGKKKRRRRQSPAKPRARPAARGRAVDGVLAALAHDIRTPLTGILALGELLATSEIGERERQWAAGIKSTAEHLAGLTSLIVDAAKAEASGLVLRREVFSPRRLVEAVGASLAARADTKNLTHTLLLSADLPAEVRGDVVRLRAALENLIDNAVKFTENGGITLEARSKAGPGRRARLIFSISDTGLGMSAAEIRRLFRPFAQANPEIAHRYGGAGLGLASVKRIAQAMGGDLTVASVPQRGSKFQLSVAVEPIDDSDRLNGGVQIRSANRAPARKGLRILCVEDNPYGRVVLNTILTELGHGADFVGTGEAAVIAVDRGGHDLVLMDITLPGINGIETARRIRALEAGRDMPVVGITGRASAADERSARDAGMVGYITKPISPSALAEAIAQATARPV